MIVYRIYDIIVAVPLKRGVTQLIATEQTVDSDSFLEILFVITSELLCSSSI